MKHSWYTNRVDEKSPDDVHQTLAFGTLDDIRSLEKKLGVGKLKELFLLYPKKVYTIPAFNFVKNFILQINGSVDEQKYLKNTPRRIG